MVTSQYKEGVSLVIARTDTPTSPVSMMQRYFAIGNLKHFESQDKVLTNCSNKAKGERLRKRGSSYSRLRELPRDKVAILGMDPNPFGMRTAVYGQVGPLRLPMFPP